MVPEILHTTLPNGIEVVLKENHFTPTVAIQAWVGIGSIHEGPTERGMAHFLEHMLFKGTTRRAVGEIASIVEGCGGEINAFTTFDHTVYHLTLAAPHAAVGVDLLCDAFAHSLLDKEEFDREREVIVEEIRRGNDSPGGKVGRRVFELCFAGSEAGRPIIGSEESVRSFKRDDLHAFYSRWYKPANLTVVVVGDFVTADMLKMVQETFGALKPEPMAEKPALRILPKTATGPTVSIIRGDFQQPRAELVFPAPSLEHFDSTALDLAAFALGSGELSRLNRRLRDGEAVVTSVGASVYSPLFGGLFELSALTSPEMMTAAIAGLGREVEILRTREPVSGEELQRARASLKADRIYQEETVDGQARSLGFGMRTAQKLLYDDVYVTLMNTMPASAVAEAVSRWLRPEAAILVVLVHNDSKLTEADVRTAYQRGVEEAQKTAKSVSTRRTAASSASKKDAEVIALKNGVSLIYRYNPNVELFTLTAGTEAGMRAESAATAGLGHALSGLLGLASEQHPYAEMMEEVEGKGASLEGFSGKDSFGFHLQCLTEHAEPMLGLLRECWFSPDFPEEQWTSLKRETLQTIKAQSDSPSGICIRRFQELIFGEHPYRYPLVGTQASVEAMSTELLARAYRDLLASGPWTVAVASTLPAKTVARLVEETLEGFAPNPARRVFASDRLIGQNQAKRLHMPKDREQTHLVYGFPGITWGDADRPALDVLVNVLGGHGGRLFRELRDKDSLAYTVSPIISYGRHPGAVGSYIACAPDKAKRAMEGLEIEMMKLVHAAPSSAEVERSRNHIIGTHDMGLQKSDSQTSTMALMELYGYGYDDFLTYPKAIAKVTAADVQRVAKRLFVAEKAASVTVGK